MFTITNTTATFRVHGGIDFKTISHLCHDKEKQEFRQLILDNDIRQPIALIYKPDSVMIIGCKSIEDVNNSVRKICTMIDRELRGTVEMSKSIAKCRIHGNKINIKDLKTLISGYDRASKLPRGYAATFRVCREVDFDSIAHLCHPRHERAQGTKAFRQLILKLTEPRSTALIYESGRIVLVGCKSTHDVDHAAEKTCNLIDKKMMEKPVISNAVGRCEIDGTKINLRELENYFREYYGENGIPRGCAALYVPELFPGLTLCPSRTKKYPTILLFSSGKAIITGCRSIEEVEEAHTELLTVLLTRMIETNYCEMK